MFGGSCPGMLCVHVSVDSCSMWTCLHVSGGSMEEFAAVVTRQMSEEERLVMIVGPRSNADVIVLREVRWQR